MEKLNKEQRKDIARQHILKAVGRSVEKSITLPAEAQVQVAATYVFEQAIERAKIAQLFPIEIVGAKQKKVLVATQPEALSTIDLGQDNYAMPELSETMKSLTIDGLAGLKVKANLSRETVEDASDDVRVADLVIEAMANSIAATLDKAILQGYSVAAANNPKTEFKGLAQYARKVTSIPKLNTSNLATAAQNLKGQYVQDPTKLYLFTDTKSGIDFLFGADTDLLRLLDEKTGGLVSHTEAKMKDPQFPAQSTLYPYSLVCNTEDYVLAVNPMRLFERFHAEQDLTKFSAAMDASLIKITPENDNNISCSGNIFK